MVSVVIPTYNRAYTLAKVLPTYYEQFRIKEVIILDDAGSDNTNEVVEEIGKKYFPNVKTIYHRQKVRGGASAARKAGLHLASSDYVFFGEDDAFIDKNHIEVLVALLREDNVKVVSGRIVYLLPGEEQSAADARIDGIADNSRGYVDTRRLALDHTSRLPGETVVAFTHALILARRIDLLRCEFDLAYLKGNGFREETDFQITAAGKSGSIVVTEDCRCYHLAHRDVPHGGQRIPRVFRYYWAIRYNNYFVDKHFLYLSDFLPKGRSKISVKLSFAVLYMMDLFLLPILKRFGK